MNGMHTKQFDRACLDHLCFDHLSRETYAKHSVRAKVFWPSIVVARSPQPLVISSFNKALPCIYFVFVSYRLCCSSIQTVPAADQTDETFCRWILKRKRPKVSVASQIVNGLYWCWENWVHARFVSVWGVRKKIYPCFEWLKGRKIGKLKVVYSVDNKENIIFVLTWEKLNKHM